ncbi:HTH-type transcriptional regulator CynR [Pelagimonas phthalicica]|uniref:HTH-type transcriptional regulator CynR n=1 Tax=Pelagimonas phthalicica TaxID=1037362 RepID=A0A238J7E4_9RHOB|nr:LysR substrate-binding domain-containing protein [Pelagimonas phthalicica]TDS94851.1 LysR family transcriptional regulator [Pelagimonas phthalicica]SMX26620.1 HTH-type transcriptional regulator CynR [Pelagimonas phthalicica]
MKFQLRQLEAFRAVAEAGNITRAAKNLGVSQPAVSRLLSDFAKSVGFELFERRRGVLEPTSESRYLLTEVTRILDGLDHLEDLRRDLTERTAGHIRIACLPGFATSHLPKVLVDFLKERPGVTVTIDPDRPERILEWIIGEQYDCGLTDGFAGHPATESRDLFIKSVCILPKGHPLQSKQRISPADLADEKMIHTKRDSRFYYRLSRAFSDAGVAINSWVEVRQFTTACTMVSKGMGASIVSALDAEQFREAGIVIRPFDPPIYHRLSILRPATGARTPVVIDFIEAFIQSLTPFLAEAPVETAKLTS